MTEEAVTAAELADILHCHVETVYSKARSGDIPSIRLGRSWRFFPSQVQAHLAPSNDPWAQPARSKRRRAA